MRRKFLLKVTREIINDIFVILKEQGLTKGYLLALSVLIVGLLLTFVALHPVVLSFIYPLF